MLYSGNEFRAVVEDRLGPLSKGAKFIGSVGERLNCVAAFENYNGTNVDIHLISFGSITRELLYAAGKFAFGQLGCIRMTGIMTPDNPMNEVVPRLGFVLEGRCRKSIGNDDAMIYGCLAEEYKYGRKESAKSRCA